MKRALDFLMKSFGTHEIEILGLLGREQFRQKLASTTPNVYLTHK